MDVDEATELGEDILAMIDEDISAQAWSKAAAFFERCQTNVKGILETIENLGRVSERQEEVLRAWKEKVGRWIRD